MINVSNTSSEDKERHFNHSENDEVEFEEVEVQFQTVTVKDVASNLKTSISTVSRYAGILEHQGYRFKKRGKARLYSHEDQLLIERMQNIVDHLGFSVEIAAKNALANDKSVSEQLNDLKETNKQKELALVDYSSKLNQIMGLLTENFSTKSEINELTQIVKQVVEQDAKKDELIQKQDDIILQLIKGREDDKQEKAMLKEQLDDSNSKLGIAVDVLQRLEYKVDNLEKTKEKKKFFGLF